MKKKKLSHHRVRRFIRRRPRTRFGFTESCIRTEQTWKYLSREIPAEEPVLDQEVWKRSLPDDVFCTILARLPMSSLFRFRTVCKSWCGMVFDPNFLEACSRVSTRQPSLVFKNDEGCSIYEPDTDKWMPVPASFFYPKNETHYKVVDSKGGQVLLLRNYHLMLFNPLNQSQKHLPPMIDMNPSDLPSVSDIHIIGMYVDDREKVLNILVVDKKSNVVEQDEEDNEMDDEFDDLDILTQVFDSKSNSWLRFASLRPEYELSIVNASVFGGTMHCLTKAKEAHPYYNQLEVYSMLEDSCLWDENAIDMPQDDQELVSPHLFTHGRNQLLVAALPARRWPRGGGDFPVWKNIIIWEAQLKETAPKVHEWVKVFEIESREVQEELWNIHVKNFFFHSGGDFVYFGSKTGSTLGLIDLKSHTWRLLPTFPEYTPYDGRDLDDLNFTSFLFEPRFELVV